MTITTSERETGTPAPSDMTPLLVVDGLRTYFDLRHGVVKAEIGRASCRERVCVPV